MWDAVLDDAALDALIPGGIGEAGGDPSDDGFLMTAGLKNASKCRDCAKTLDIGTPAWFKKDGEPGRKVTCQECHKHKYGDAPLPSEAADRADKELLEKTRKKNKKAAPKFAPELLLDRDKGMTAIFKSFPKLKFKGKGHEASDLRRLLGKYAEWAHVLVPDMDFGEFVTKLEKSANHRVKTKLELLRNVQQGECSLEDIDEYELADKDKDDRHVPTEDWLARMEREAEAGGGGGGGGGADAGGDGGSVFGGGGFGGGGFEEEAMPAPPKELNEEQRERMERNKRIALEKAAARKAAGNSGGAGNGAGAAAAIDREDEEMAMAEMAGGGGGGGGFDDEFDDEEAALEAEMGFDDAVGFDEPPPPPARQAAAAAAEKRQAAFEQAAAMEAEMEMGMEPGPPLPEDGEDDPPPPDDELTFREPVATNMGGATQLPSASQIASQLPMAAGEDDDEAAAAEEEDAARQRAQAAAAALEAGFDDDDEL